MGDNRPLAVVLGPTGSGKSDLALDIAQQFDGEIVNCDSLQLFRGFDVGTAKTPLSERRGIPHHLLDALEPDQVCTAGEYLRMARRAVREIAGRGRLPVVVGGTGFYLRALLYGLFPGPSRDEALRRRLAEAEARRPGLLARALRRLDPEAARRIHAHDEKKLLRAVEVCVLARRPITEMFAGGRDPFTGYDVLKIGLNPPRPALHARLDARCARMWNGGLMEEVRGLLAAGVSPGAKPFESIGYKQALEFLSGASSSEVALQAMQAATRQYAKRQMTWFRKEPEIHWFVGFGDEPPTRSAVLSAVNTHLRVV